MEFLVDAVLAARMSKAIGTSNVLMMYLYLYLADFLSALRIRTGCEGTF